MLPIWTEAEGAAVWIFGHVMAVPVGELEAEITLTVCGVLAASVTRPEAIACLTLPSLQEVLTTT